MVHDLELLQRDQTCLPHASVSIVEGFPHANLFSPMFALALNILFHVFFNI